MFGELGGVDQVELGGVLHQSQLPAHTPNKGVVGKHVPVHLGPLLLHKITKKLNELNGRKR